MPKLGRTEGARASAASDNGSALSAQQDDRGSGGGSHGPRHKATTAIPSSEPRKLGQRNRGRSGKGSSSVWSNGIQARLPRQARSMRVDGSSTYITTRVLELGNWTRSLYGDDPRIRLGNYREALTRK
jgi:hypothetical protein